MLNHELNSNKALKEQVEINLENSFGGAIMMHVRKVLQKLNTRVISLLMFYENRKNMKFKVLSSIVYCIMENFFVLIICVFLKHNFMLQVKYKGLKTEHKMNFQELELLKYN